MFYTKKSRSARLKRHRAVRSLVRIVAGIHAANGVAHGVPVARNSAARQPDSVQLR